MREVNSPISFAANASNVADQSFAALTTMAVSGIKDSLQQRGVRLTRQRKILLDLIDQSGQHLDADRLYELARDPKAATAKQPKRIVRASAGETEQVTLMLLDILRKSGYTNPVTEGSTEEKVRRLVRRLDIAGRDAPVLLGMLRQILWKIG